LRDIPTNVYEHAGLSAVYPDAAVRQALEQCHQELFERILETPLAGAEQDLRAHLRTLPNGSRRAAAQWRRLESYRGLLPAESPEYLKEPFARMCVPCWRFSRKSFQRNRPLVAIPTTHSAISVHPKLPRFP